MIKKFSEFVNESFYERNTTGGVYGDILFESISNSLISVINNDINEGRIRITGDVLDEGFLSNWFKGMASKADQKATEKIDKSDELRREMEKDVHKLDKDAVVDLAKEIRETEVSSYTWDSVQRLCESAAKLCEDLEKKEEAAKSAITRKMNETKEAIATFIEEVKETFRKIAEQSKDKIKDIMDALKLFIGKLAEISKKAVKKIKDGVIIAVCVPFVIAYATYKSVVVLCEKLCAKANKVWNDVRDALDKYGKMLSEWFKNQINTIKETLKKWADDVKEAGDAAYKSVAKAYLYVVNTIGLVIDKSATAISDAFNSFVESAKSYSEKVKSYISDRLDVLEKWVDEKKGEFVDGVKSVLNAFKSKITEVVGKVKDSYEWMKDFAGQKIEDYKNWKDDRKRDYVKKVITDAVERFGRDEVRSWI